MCWGERVVCGNGRNKWRWWWCFSFLLVVFRLCTSIENRIMDITTIIKYCSVFIHTHTYRVWFVPYTKKKLYYYPSIWTLLFYVNVIPKCIQTHRWKPSLLRLYCINRILCSLCYGPLHKSINLWICVYICIIYMCI